MLLYLIKVKWDQCPYLSDFSSINGVTFPSSSNSSFVGKACSITSPCLPSWRYLLLCVNSLPLFLILLYLLSGEVESVAENWEWVTIKVTLDLGVEGWVGVCQVRKGSWEFSIRRKARAQWAVQGNSEWKLQNGPQLGDAVCLTLTMLKLNQHFKIAGFHIKIGIFVFLLKNQKLCQYQIHEGS